MDRSPLLHPVGPEPTGVYWVRRLGVLALLLVLVAGVAYACSAGGSGDGRATLRTPATSAPTTSASPSPSAAGPVERCQPAVLTVTAATDDDTYEAGAMPRFTAVVRNEGTRPCRLATEPSARVWTVVSGPDEVWSTAACEQPGKPSRQRLEAGHQVTYAVGWDRHRSIEGCAGTGAEAQPGTYRLLVTVDHIDAEPVVFHLTD